MCLERPCVCSGISTWLYSLGTVLKPTAPHLPQALTVAMAGRQQLSSRGQAGPSPPALPRRALPCGHHPAAEDRPSLPPSSGPSFSPASRSTAQEPLRCPGHFHSPGECMCWVCLFSRGFFLIRIETGVEDPASRAEAGAGALSRPSRPHSAPSVGLRAARQARRGLVVALGPLTHSVCHARPSRCRPAEAFSAGARPARDAPSARGASLRGQGAGGLKPGVSRPVFPVSPVVSLQAVKLVLVPPS